MPIKDLVSVTLVTYNSGRFIKRCLESVLEQKYPSMEVIVVDNASTDGTVDLLEPFSGRCRIYYNNQNTGFAAAQNQAIGLSSGEWILTINPDLLLQSNFIQALLEAARLDPQAGTICGKLLNIPASFCCPKNSSSILPVSISRRRCVISTAVASKSTMDTIQNTNMYSEPPPPRPFTAAR